MLVLALNIMEIGINLIVGNELTILSQLIVLPVPGSPQFIIGH